MKKSNKTRALRVHGVGKVIFSTYRPATDVRNAPTHVSTTFRTGK